MVEKKKMMNDIKYLVKLLGAKSKVLQASQKEKRVLEKEKKMAEKEKTKAIHEISYLVSLLRNTKEAVGAQVKSVEAAVGSSEVVQVEAVSVNTGNRTLQEDKTNLGDGQYFKLNKSM